MAFPTTSILDSGTRADESPATGWTDGPDGTNYGNIKVLSNQLVPISGDAWPYWNAGTFGADTEVYLTEPSLGSNMFVYARLTPIGVVGVDGYVLGRTSTTTYIIRRLDNDVETTLGATITIGTPVTSGASFGLSCVGSTMTGYYKPSAGSWTVLDTRSDATYSAAGYIAVYFVTSAGVMTNFGGGTVVVTSTGHSLSTLGVGA